MCHELYEERFTWTKADDELRERDTEHVEAAQETRETTEQEEELEHV
jgi:hypothetical protein